MTKKTNSLIFRFGISVLWKNKFIGNKNIKNILQIETILYKEFYKKKLTVLKIQYKPYVINIFFYNDYKLYNKQKRQVNLYYKKVLHVQKTIEMFGLKRKFFYRFLTKIKIKKIRFFRSNINLKLLIFFYKRYFLC